MFNMQATCKPICVTNCVSHSRARDRTRRIITYVHGLRGQAIQINTETASKNRAQLGALGLAGVAIPPRPDLLGLHH